MRGWFFIVFRAFMILGVARKFEIDDPSKKPEKYAPDNGSLDNVFAILVDGLQDIT